MTSRPALLMVLTLTAQTVGAVEPLDSARDRPVGAPLHKVAVLVGANAATRGRSKLRFAQHDAEQLAEVLQLTGGLAADDLTVLADPAPDEVLAALDRRLVEASQRQGETLLLFYYSGHADDVALYPSGQALPLSALKARLDDSRAAVRLGILDACRGGAWTRAKGLTAEAPFDISVPVELGAEGSALIASSAGSESAHESDALQGSFFTHHLVAGLRGAADSSHDGTVTLQEAFEHARRLTVRDTALQAPMPQHPSFDMRLRGRTDVVLASIGETTGGLTLSEHQGPLQVIQLSSGLVVADLEPGDRLVRVAVPPGRYVVRRHLDESTSAREVEVLSGKSLALDETQLTLVGSDELSRKAPVELPGTMTTLPSRVGEWKLGFGVQHGEGGVSVTTAGLTTTGDFAYGITDRLQINLLSFGYRFGETGEREWLPWGGVTGVGAGFSSVEGTIFNMSLGGGIDLRQTIARHHSLVLGFDAQASGSWSSLHVQKLNSWEGRLQVGYSVTLFDTVSLSIGAGWAQRISAQGQFAPWTLDGLQPTLAVGGVLNCAGRNRPLVQVHLTPRFSLDGNARVGVNVATGRLTDAFTIGFTWDFGA